MLILKVLRLCLDIGCVEMHIQHGSASFWLCSGAEFYSQTRDADPPKWLILLMFEYQIKWKLAMEIHLWVESRLLSQSLVTHIFKGLLVVHNRPLDLYLTGWSNSCVAKTCLLQQVEWWLLVSPSPEHLRHTLYKCRLKSWVKLFTLKSIKYRCWNFC